MAIDASIYGQIQQPQFESPINALARVTQLKGAQNQNRLFDMQVADKEAARASELALNNAYQNALGANGEIDRTKLMQGLAQGGHGSKLPAIQKGFNEQDKAAKEAELSNLKSAREKQAIVAQVAGAAKDQASWSNGLQQLQSMGIDVSKVPQNYDPMQAQLIVQQSLTGLQRIDQVFKEKEFSYKQQNDSANRGVTMRGQNMTDARARDLAAATREAGGAGRPPVGYRWKQDGSGALEPIPGGPGVKDKAPTEFQGKSATFGARAEQADKIIKDIEGKYWPSAVNAKQALGNTWLVGGALEAGGNLLLSKEGQKAEQAQRDFVNAVLRQESGAAIAESEFNNAKKQYFPQPGDSKEVINQKAQNRKTAIEGFKKNAGQAAYTATTEVSEPDINSLLDKYK